MTLSELLMAVFWGFVLHLPWIAGVVVAVLFYWRWRTSSVGLVALALGLLITWRVIASLVPVAVILPLVEPGHKLFTVDAVFRFVDVGFQTVLVVLLAVGFLRLMRDLAANRS